MSHDIVALHHTLWLAAVEESQHTGVKCMHCPWALASSPGSSQVFNVQLAEVKNGRRLGKALFSDLVSCTLHNSYYTEALAT